MADEEVVKWLKGLLAAHNTSEYPLILGTTEQAEDLLEVIGQWGSYKSGNIPGMVYDDMIAYYNDGAPGNIITGKAEEAKDKTPVGVVTHPAPLDITSWLYWTPLVAQGIEKSYSAIKNALNPEVSDEFMKEISIADVMGKVAGYENKKSDDKPNEKSEYLGHTYSSSFTFDGNTWYNPLMKENNYRQKTRKSRTRKKSNKSEKPLGPITNSIKIENYNNTPIENKPKESLEEIERKIKGYLV